MAGDRKSEDEKRLYASPGYWDEQAASYDDAPDHGLNHPAVKRAWTELLRLWLPDPKVRIVDMGCGTGSLSLVLAGLGHAVIGIDSSPEMIARARSKAAASGYPIEFHIMDAASPQLPAGHFDAVVCRHLLWALPGLARVLQRWAELLKPDGRLFLVEGYWSTGGGLHATEIIEALPPTLTDITVKNLSDHQALWGGEVQDERYLLFACKRHLDS